MTTAGGKPGAAGREEQKGDREALLGGETPNGKSKEDSLGSTSRGEEVGSKKTEVKRGRIERGKDNQTRREKGGASLQQRRAQQGRGVKAQKKGKNSHRKFL